MNKISYFFCAALIVCTNLVAQNDGDLDLTFNGVGYTTYQPSTSNDNPQDVAVLPDGKFLFCGSAGPFSNLEMVVLRANADGTLDNSFATNGQYTLLNTGGSDFAYQMKVLPSGKILIGGGYSLTAANTAFLIVQLNADGTPDESFGNNGVAIIEIDNGEDYCKSLHIQPDGSIICSGFSYVPGFTYQRIALCKITQYGVLDPNFGTNGKVTYQATNTSTYSIEKAVQVGDDIYLAGSSYNEAAFSDYPIIAKFNTSGVIDNTFGTGGVWTGTVKGRLFSIGTDGAVLHVVGSDDSNNSGSKGVISSYNLDGSLNTSFGTNGSTLTNINPLTSWDDLYYQSDDKIITCGQTGTGIFDRYILVGRFLANGTLDTDFGTNGYTTFDLGSFFDFANAIAIQPDGKIIVAGVTASSDNDMLLIRLQNGLPEIQPLAASVTGVTAVTCYGGNDGTATVMVTGGLPPFTYYVDGGSTDAGNPVLNLDAGNHSILITDSQGSTFSVTATITEPQLLTAVAAADGNDVMVVASGGTPPYTYWYDGNLLQTTGLFENLGIGSYIFNVFDSHGCETQTQAEVLVGLTDALQTSLVVTPTLSEGLFTVRNNRQTAAKLQVINVVGQQVNIQNWPAGSDVLTLDLTQMPNGFYWIKLGTDIVKVAVQH